MSSVYGWLKAFLIFFMIVSILEQLIVNESYRKYIRQFAGIMFLILFISPVVSLFFGGEDIEKKIEKSSVWAEYEAQVKDGEYMLDKKLDESQKNVGESCSMLVKSLLEADQIEVSKVVINGQDLTVTVAEGQTIDGVQDKIEKIIEDAQITGVKNIEVVRE